ncbi:antibiotic biosynthesis monooxygenase [Bacillus aquiflavi]|uniref:Antibiotic biosynthesis monooxygenase n=1 Tax=Bacillus aquiflavi TaxID=2672567 RepID=A0A6B3VP30_9BACI|nr:antibiotic biosynthesis monooxygenase [Bacillus aquiflavi]MBA4535684.1 antibiotic biosynthesis monooxygenase [Bacillus aquiflavi]NEY80060.1 antibiotic biosynthesis monooxygenase [Bacillus aquiflavi]
MKIFMTNGTIEYLKKVMEKHKLEKMILMENENTALLLHETNGKTIFNEPRSYEIIDQAGTLQQYGFVAMNNIPVTDEGRPIFEYRFKNRARLIENEPGFVAIRVLRPLIHNTYIILTIWENPQAFEAWQQSKSYKKAHKKQKSSQTNNETGIFAAPSYVTKYIIPTEEEEEK